MDWMQDEILCSLSISYRFYLEISPLPFPSSLPLFTICHSGSVCVVWVAKGGFNLIGYSCAKRDNFPLVKSRLPWISFCPLKYCWIFNGERTEIIKILCQHKGTNYPYNQSTKKPPDPKLRESKKDETSIYISISV